MKCAGCGHESPPGARFCAGCGARFAAACVACGAELPLDARFCPQCGQASLTPTAVTAEFGSPATYTPKHLADRILTSKAALEGERKQVTVLFVDVSGFTALSARLDPEDVHALMKRAFDLMLAEVHRYDGTVNQFLGDGIMALFGAPIAHEDHAQRAVRAALGIQRALEAYRRDLEGEPGIGKSRLLYEFRGRTGDADWREGHCLSFGRATAFHPLVDLLKRWVGIDERDPEDVAAAKVERTVGDLGDDLRTATPSLQYLLSLGAADAAIAALDPRERRSGIFEALRRMILRAAERRPQIVVIEDLHWIDRATEEFLAVLGDSVPASPVLLIFTYRPGYAQPFGERTYHTRIVPAPLSEPESARMAAAILSSGALPERLRSAIAAKAEGNPFYVEEVVRSLHETGAIRVEDGRLVLAARPH